MIERADKRTGKNRNKIRTALDGTTEIRAVSASRQSGWTPCAMENGGCTHLCFYVRKNYTCGCPDQPDSRTCSIGLYLYNYTSNHVGNLIPTVYYIFVHSSKKNYAITQTWHGERSKL